MKFADRLLTIAVTATLTSAAWIVFGGSLLRQAPVPVIEPAAVPDDVKATGLAPRGNASSAAPLAVDGGLVVPVAGVSPSQLVDTYSQSRGGGSRLHEAIDIMAPAGTPVIAAAAGTVEKIFLSDDGGKTIYIRLPDRRFIHYYAHLAEYAPALREGASVRQGETLGTVGVTGNSAPDAPHLHFALMQIRPDQEWYEPSTAINPYPLLTSR